MRLLMISTDKKILEDGSAAKARHFEYGKICDELHIVVLHGNRADSQSNTPLSGCLKSVIPSGAKRSREPVPSLSREIPLARERLILAKEIPPLPLDSLRSLGVGRDDKTTFLDSLLSPLKGGINGNARIYGVQGSSKITRLWNGYKKAKDIVGKENIDLVTTQDAGFTGLIGYLLKRKYGVRLNVQIHGKEEKLLNKILLFPFQKKIIKSADSIRVVSERLKRMVVEKYSIADKKIYIVPIYSEMIEKLRNSSPEIKQAISRGKEIKKLEIGNWKLEAQELRVKNKELRDTDKNDAGMQMPARTTVQSGGHANDTNSEDGFTILTVGRLVKVKNIKLQIEALADVVKIFPDTRLVIAGDGSEKENLQKITKKFKLEDKVEFAGAKWGLDLCEYYNKADLFVLTSNSEGWGMVIIEAMAAGAPVIMTDVGCAGEVVKNGENGIVIPTGDRKALIAAICDMIADVDKREKFSKNGKMAVDNLPYRNLNVASFRTPLAAEESPGARDGQGIAR